MVALVSEIPSEIHNRRVRKAEISQISVSCQTVAKIIKISKILGLKLKREKKRI